MLGLTEFPDRPYRSFEGYLYELRKHGRGHGREHPCPRCCGRGRVVVPGTRCPIEGNKMADWMDCQFCEGTGETTREVLRGMYNNIMDRWRQERESIRKLRIKQAAILKKLTRAERAILSFR